MHKYGIVIFWSDEDQTFIAEVPELPGCITHGDTQAAALASATEAIQSWVNTANEFGDPVPQPRGRPNVLIAGEFESPRLEKKQRATMSLRRKNQPIRSKSTSPPVMNPRAH